MVQQGGVEPFEQPVVDHELLARAALLGGRAEEDDLTADLRRDGSQRDGRADATGGHRVVPAAVAQAGQRVVLGQDADSCALASPAGHARAQRSRQPADWKLDGVAMTGQGLCHPGGGLVLLEGRFRVGVDALREVDDLGTRVLDGRRDARLHCRRDPHRGLSRSVAAELA